MTMPAPKPSTRRVKITPVKDKADVHEDLPPQPKYEMPSTDRSEINFEDFGSESGSTVDPFDVPLGSPRNTRQTKFAKRIEDLYGGIGFCVGMFDPYCANAILANAKTMAESMEQLALENPEIKKWLERLMMTSAWSGVLVAHMPIIMAIASHHVPVFRDRMMQMAMNSEAATNGGPTES